MIESILDDDNNWSVFGSFIQCNTYFFQSRLLPVLLVDDDPTPWIPIRLLPLLWKKVSTIVCGSGRPSLGQQAADRVGPKIDECAPLGFNTSSSCPAESSTRCYSQHVNNTDITRTTKWIVSDITPPSTSNWPQIHGRKTTQFSNQAGPAACQGKWVIYWNIFGPWTALGHQTMGFRVDTLDRLLTWTVNGHVCNKILYPTT